MRGLNYDLGQLEPEAMRAYAALLRRHVARVQQASAQLWAAAEGKPMEAGSADARDYLIQMQMSLGEIGNVAEVLEVEGAAGQLDRGPEESGTRLRTFLTAACEYPDQDACEDDAGRGTMRSARYAV